MASQVLKVKGMNLSPEEADLQDPGNEDESVVKEVA